MAPCSTTLVFALLFIVISCTFFKGHGTRTTAGSLILRESLAEIINQDLSPDFRKIRWCYHKTQLAKLNLTSSPIVADGTTDRNDSLSEWNLRPDVEDILRCYLNERTDTKVTESSGSTLTTLIAASPSSSTTPVTVVFSTTTPPSVTPGVGSPVIAGTTFARPAPAGPNPGTSTGTIIIEHKHNTSGGGFRMVVGTNSSFTFVLLITIIVAVTICYIVKKGMWCGCPNPNSESQRAEIVQVSERSTFQPRRCASGTYTGFRYCTRSQALRLSVTTGNDEPPPPYHKVVESVIV